MRCMTESTGVTSCGKHGGASEATEVQGRRWSYACCGGGVRNREAGYRASRGPPSREVSAASRAEAVHSETRWAATAARHTDGEGPRCTSGGEADSGTHLRGGLPALQLWVSAKAKCNRGTGDHPGESQHRVQPRARCRHPRLLRQHFARAALRAGEAAGVGPKGAEAAEELAWCRGDGRGAVPGDGLWGATRGSHFTPAFEHLPAFPRFCVAAAMR